jgi:transcriptional regulator with XRE-family HTH domain
MRYHLLARSSVHHQRKERRMSAISVQLGHLRVARGLTQQQLAERTGLRRDTISALERGQSHAIDLLVLGPTSHVAPILGGEDEDEILLERLEGLEAEIAALMANPALAAQYLTLEDDELMGEVHANGAGHLVTRGGTPAEASPADRGVAAIAARQG